MMISHRLDGRWLREKHQSCPSQRVLKETNTTIVGDASDPHNCALDQKQTTKGSMRYVQSSIYIYMYRHF